MSNIESVHPPRFCGRCGLALFEDVFTREQRYDRYLGSKLPIERHLELRCPTYEKASTHDMWRLYDGRWVKV